MKQLLFLGIILSLLFISMNGSSQVHDSDSLQSQTSVTDTLGTSTPNEYVDEDFNPGLFIMAIMGIGLISFCIGVGSIITIAVLLVLFGLVSVGILSTSLFIGLSKRSVASGFKTLLILSTCAAGVALGIAGAVITTFLFDLALTTSTTLWIGSISGLIGGFLLGLISYIIVCQLTRYFKLRIGLV